MIDYRALVVLFNCVSLFGMNCIPANCTIWGKQEEGTKDTSSPYARGYYDTDIARWAAMKSNRYAHITPAPQDMQKQDQKQKEQGGCKERCCTFCSLVCDQLVNGPGSLNGTLYGVHLVPPHSK